VLRAGFLVVAVAAFGSSIGSASSDGFHTGDAQASADTFSLNLKAANATIGFTWGRSLAAYQDRTATSEGRALDLGVLPVLFSGVQCDGSPGILNADTLPPVSRADSSEAGSDASRRAQAFQPGIDGGPIGPSVGFQDATAAALPSSRAITESAPADLGLIALDGGRTEVTTQLADQVRHAHAVVTADQLRVFGGLFTFNQPRWEATAESGARTTSTGAFTFASATVLGIPRSPADAMSDLQGFKVGLEQLLAPLGVVLELPNVVVRDDGVKVTPMAFRIVNPPLGTQMIMPFLGQIDTQVQQWRKDLLAADCKNTTALTILDVLIGVLGGSGAAEILAGGVDVATHDTDYSIPPVEEVPQVVAVPDTTTAPPPTVADDSLLGSGTTDLGTYGDLGSTYDSGSSVDLTTPLGRTGPAPVAKAAGASEQATLPTVALGGMEDGTAGQAGVAVGVLALAGALGLSVGDRLIGRRSKRTIP